MSDTHVVGDARCPYVGAIIEHIGAWLLRNPSMRTKFVNFDRPCVAAAIMLGTSFPFALGCVDAASRHCTAVIGNDLHLQLRCQSGGVVLDYPAVCGAGVQLAERAAFYEAAKISCDECR